MATLLPILRNRRRRREAARRSPLAPLAGTMVFIFSAGFTVLACGIALCFYAVNLDLPAPETLARLIEPPDGLIYHPTEIYDRSGKILLMRLENPAARGRAYLPFAEGKSDHLPEILGKATVAVCDADFWQHPGVTWQSAGSPRAHTIAERLADQFLLPDEPPGLLKTVRQKWLALQITGRYGRERVLEWYLNSANYGRLAYGADAAARVYLGKSAGRLNLAEAALLAALPEAPALNPIDAPNAALERQQKTLDLLEEKGLITAAEGAQARAVQLTFQDPQDWPENDAAVFTQYAIRQLVDLMGWERLERGGMEVITTLDVPLQNQAACAAQIHVDHLKGMASPIAEGHPSCEAARLLPSLPSAPEIPSGQDVAVDLALMDVKTGQILALYSQHPPTWETSLQEGRPAGSALTPFVYLAGFGRGYTPASLVWDVPEDASNPPMPHYDQTYTGPMRLRNALANDILSPAVEIYRQVGESEIARHFRQFGIETFTTDGENPASVLWEGGNVRLLDLLQAYATLADQGTLAGQSISANETDRRAADPEVIKPSALLTVTDINHNIWLDWGRPQSKPVLTPELAYLMTNILGDEPLRWKTLGQPNPLEIGRPAGVKIGRTLAGKDAWAVGYTPGLAAAVWIGALEGNTILPQTAAAPLWNAVMRYADEDIPVQSWVPPEGIHAVQVCDPSGMLPTPQCPNVVREVFLRGTEPTQTDTLFHPVQVDVETGRLATIYTPLDAIDEKTYLRFPPQAIGWAQEAHISLPPAAYDTLMIPSSSAQDVSIDRPGQYGYIHGLVDIFGTADSDDFASYRLKIGQGLNPAQWLNIAAASPNPVRKGKLAQWDTRGLNGLYILELMVEDSQQRVTTYSIPLTIDNRAPVLDILSPDPGQVMEMSPADEIAFHVSAADDLGISRLSFFINGREIGRLSQPPYVFFWRGKPGSYTLEVEGSDFAGNVQRRQVTFIVTPRN